MSCERCTCFAGASHEKKEGAVTRRARRCRTSDLQDAIRAHRSDGNQKFGPSEANAVIDKFNRLDERDKQDLLNFLRSF